MEQSKKAGSSKPGVTGRTPGKKKTPPNIHAILKEKLGKPLGLADDTVFMQFPV